ncbi:hypothetical protein K3495_g13534 [Podosphaera aphanis]|nr:hypothetical protein K3495_g13534 [Podosphaera aphanis]
MAISSQTPDSRLELPKGIRIFPILYASLFRRKDPDATGPPGQGDINGAKSKNIRGRVLERDDSETEVERWEFTDILDSDDDLGPVKITYLVKWKHQKSTWQIANDLKGQENAILRFHETYSNKPGPPE